MIADREQTIAQYREADFNQRLNMYLQYPALRSEFIRIDQGDRDTAVQAGFQFKFHSSLPRLNEIIRSLASGIRKFVGAGSA